MNKIVRNFVSDFETRDSDTEKGIIVGHPVVYDSETIIGGQYKEIIERGALDDCDLRDVLFFTNHDINSFDFSGLYGANVALAGGYGGSYSNVTNNDSNVTYSPVFNYNKPLSSREIYRQNKNMLSHVLNK